MKIYVREHYRDVKLPVIIGGWPYFFAMAWPDGYGHGQSLIRQRKPNTLDARQA